LQERALLNVYLYAHRRQESELLFEWEGSAQLDLKDDCLAYLGLPAARRVTHSDLLRFLYAASKSVARWAYGISYLHPARRGPDLYSFGMTGGVLPSARAKKTEIDTREFKKRVGAWFGELLDTRRHLEGYVRDVFPANLLTEAHVRARLGGRKTLLKSGLGKFEEIDEGVWLWEVPREQLLSAREQLHRAGLLLCP
jgi:hypothetical protein